MPDGLLTLGDAHHQYYETICGGARAGADLDSASAVHTHMTNCRLTDPLVLAGMGRVIVIETPDNGDYGKRTGAVKQHYERFARYNQWANLRLYGAADSLSEEKLWRDLKAFFGSLMGTLNHVLVADTLWLARFTQESPPPLQLNSILHRDLPGLRRSREALDARIVAFVGSLDEARLAAALDYVNMQGERLSYPLETLLAHFFNHQAHHRGQAHGLLSQLGAEPPVLDLMYFIRQS